MHDAQHGAHRLGMTGPPGAGKSTLVDQLIRRFRESGERVAVLAIDPSSPFSGGALLGDRIRMQTHAGDDGVYIRSIGSRGARGGLAQAARAITEIFDAYGYDRILIETVGVGQSEFDIMELADTTLVILVPEAGDTVQTLKAGLLEIADGFVVNKGDRPGADAMAQALAAMIALDAHGDHPIQEEHDAAHRVTRETIASPSSATGAWAIPVLTTTALTGDGIDRLYATIRAHQSWMAHHPAASEKKRAVRRAAFYTLCATLWLERVEQAVADNPALARIVDAIARGKANPYDMAQKILAQCATS